MLHVREFLFLKILLLLFPSSFVLPLFCLCRLRFCLSNVQLSRICYHNLCFVSPFRLCSEPQNLEMPVFFHNRQLLLCFFFPSSFLEEGDSVHFKCISVKPVKTACVCTVSRLVSALAILAAITDLRFRSTGNTLFTSLPPLPYPPTLPPSLCRRIDTQYQSVSRAEFSNVFDRPLRHPIRGSRRQHTCCMYYGM